MEALGIRLRLGQEVEYGGGARGPRESPSVLTLEDGERLEADHGAGGLGPHREHRGPGAGGSSA